MNIARSHLDALGAFGYTEDEARLLYIVATYSGYFVARQFLDVSSASIGASGLRSFGASLSVTNTPASTAIQKAERSTISVRATSLSSDRERKPSQSPRP